MTKQRYEVGDYVVVNCPTNELYGKVARVAEVYDLLTADIFIYLLAQDDYYSAVGNDKGDIYLVVKDDIHTALSGRWLSRPLVMADSAAAIVEQMQNELEERNQNTPPSPNLYADLYHDVVRYINMGYEVPLPFDDLGESEQDDD